MPRLAEPAFFDPDGLRVAAVGIAGELRDHDSRRHRHRMAQLLFAASGCVSLLLGPRQSLCLLPPTRAAWIPAGVAHRTRIVRPVDYRSVWFDPEVFTTLPAEPRILGVGALLAALLEHMALAPFATDWREGKAALVATLAVAEINDAHREPLLLPLPSDRRLAILTANLETLPPPLAELAQRVGASVSTISRILQRETGMSYQRWRQQWRLMRAIEQLANGQRQSEIADALEFASDSAFITFFRAMTGTTPRRYLYAQRADQGNDVVR